MSGTPQFDATDTLVEAVRAASSQGTPLRIVGGDTKSFYGRHVHGLALHVGDHRGVLAYDPAELVITARAGTRLADVEALLLQHGQRLPFEPPAFGDEATIGGTVAAGLAGPARVAYGPVRDYVLGARVLTGDGRVLRFGGEVMKNVAGYDVSRLMAGSLGILGVLLDVSLKVLPRPAATRTLRQQIDANTALKLLADATQRGAPVTGSFWHANELHVRLEASPAGLDAVQASIGGEVLADDTATRFWQDVREQRHAYFAAAPALHRLSLPANATMPSGDRSIRMAFEWNGAQRWLAEADSTGAAAMAREAGGHATLFRAEAAASGGKAEVFEPLPSALMTVHRAVKKVFDPAGILNPGRMYRDL